MTCHYPTLLAEAESKLLKLGWEKTNGSYSSGKDKSIGYPLTLALEAESKLLTQMVLDLKNFAPQEPASIEKVNTTYQHEDVLTRLHSLELSMAAHKQQISKLDTFRATLLQGIKASLLPDAQEWLAEENPKPNK